MAYTTQALQKHTTRTAHRGGWRLATLSGAETLTWTASHFQFLDPGGSDRTITLPATNKNDDGAWFFFANTANAGGEDLTIQNDTPATVVTLAPGESQYVYVNSSAAWAGTAVVGLGGSTNIQSLTDNSATAFRFLEDTNAYLTFATQNDLERVTLGKIMTGPVTTVDMSDAAHALVLGTAGAAQTQLTGNIVFCDPNSAGASEILTLPPEASCTGLIIFIINTGGEGIVVDSDAPATVITLDTAQHGLVICDGTTWYGFMGGIT